MANLKNNKNIPRLISIISEQELFDYWIKEKHTPKETQEHFNISSWEFNLLSNYYNIKQRGNSLNNYIRLVSRENLYNYYFEENHSATDTMKYFNINEHTLEQLCRYYGLPNKQSYNKDKILKDLDELEVVDYYKNHSYYNTIDYFNLRTCSHVLDTIITKYGAHKKDIKKKKFESFDEIIARVSKEEFYQYYIVENHSYGETIKHFNLGNLDKVRNYYGLHKRQFTKHNFIKIEQFKKLYTKEEFINYYIIQNHRLFETAEHFNISQDTCKLLIREYDVSKKKKEYSHLSMVNYKQTCLNKYGVENSLQLRKCRDNNEPYQSEPNKKFQKLLEVKGLTKDETFISEFALEDKRYDFKIDNYLVEVNPWATHNITWKKYCLSNKNSWSNYMYKEYHREKSLLAQKHGYKCICIWDWSDKEKIIENILNNTLNIKDTGEIKLHLFNYKTKEIVSTTGPYVVEIWDDGFELEV